MLNIWSRINFNSLGMTLDMVEDGMNNFNSGNYIPHMNLFEMQQELNGLIENEKNM